jgi:hypothetical protein
MQCSVGNGNELVVDHQEKWTTGSWKGYPGTQSSFNAEAITGNLIITKGSSHMDVHMKGSLGNLPTGNGGIHIHWGCDVSVASSVGGHYYDPNLCEDPWNVVTYTGPNFAFGKCGCMTVNDMEKYG